MSEKRSCHLSQCKRKRTKKNRIATANELDDWTKTE